MVRLNTDVGEDGDHEHVHLFLEEDTKDVLIPESLCGAVSMGHLPLERASQAVQILPVPTEVGREGLHPTLSWLNDEDLLCRECAEAYLDEVGGIRRVKGDEDA